MKVSAMTDEPVIGERWICARSGQNYTKQDGPFCLIPVSDIARELHKAAVALLEVATKEAAP